MMLHTERRLAERVARFGASKIPIPGAHMHTRVTHMHTRVHTRTRACTHAHACMHLHPRVRSRMREIGCE
eukprot:1948301-Rhodomonas_salina.1